MIVAYIFIIAISFIIIAAFLSFWFEGYFFDQRKEQLLTEGQIVSNAAIQYLHGDTSLDNTNAILEYVSNYADIDIILFDKYGYAYAASNDDLKELVGQQILSDHLEELKKGKVLEKNETLEKVFQEPVHTYEIPIFYLDSFQGAVAMATDLSEVYKLLSKVYEIIWLSAIFAIIASSIIIYYFSQKIIIKPLAKINSAADKIAKGEVNRRVDIKSNDEIGELAESFNSMADALEEVENNRRAFISNVSHEIRSPITSIKGFISGILDGVIPKEKEMYYLSIVYEEIQRLTRLVNDLLDMSAMDAGKTILNIGEYDINEIIRQCVIKFQAAIKSKKLNVDVWLDDNSVYVLIDKDKIIQVLTNLIDNAIKYVDDGGNIEIKTKVKGQKVLVSVFDDGKNIPKEDEKHIWDRFYRGDKSRTSKMSTGLGLSIVRKIISQHNEEIWVENKENKGVRFIFTLKRAHRH